MAAIQEVYRIRIDADIGNVRAEVVADHTLDALVVVLQIHIMMVERLKVGAWAIITDLAQTITVPIITVMGRSSGQ